MAMKFLCHDSFSDGALSKPVKSSPIKGRPSNPKDALLHWCYMKTKAYVSILCYQLYLTTLPNFVLISQSINLRIMSMLRTFRHLGVTDLHSVPCFITFSQMKSIMQVSLQIRSAKISI